MQPLLCIDRSWKNKIHRTGSLVAYQLASCSNIRFSKMNVVNSSEITCMLLGRSIVCHGSSQVGYYNWRCHSLVGCNCGIYILLLLGYFWQTDCKTKFLLNLLTKPALFLFLKILTVEKHGGTFLHPHYLKFSKLLVDTNHT